VISISYPTTADNITYTWDTPCPNGRGRLCSFTDRSGTTSFEYDAYGRIARKTQALQVPGAGTQTRSVQYAYTNGRLTRITYPSGYQVNYSFDAAGRISAITGKPASAATPTTILSSVTYDPFDQVTGWTWGNGTTTSRSFDRDGRVTNITSAGGANYTFDDGNRIRSITPTAGSTVPSSIYGYEAMDRLSSAQTGANSQGFTYDRNGNRLAQSGSINATYNYPRANNTLTSNRLTSVTGGTSRAHTFDAMGNITSDGVNTFEYDSRGRLSDGNSYSAVLYNALGQRVSKQLFGPTSGYSYLFDESGRLLEKCAQTSGCELAYAVHQQYIWLDDIPVAAVLGSVYVDSEGYISYGHPEELLIHTDHLNTPRRLTPLQGVANQVRWRWDSDPFGVGFANGNAENDPSREPYYFDLRFPGQLWDDETWRHYNYFRDYDPYTGRHVQSDPIGLDGGINTYAYVDGDPLGFYDPDGLSRRYSAVQATVTQIIVQAQVNQLVAQIRIYNPSFRHQSVGRPGSSPTRHDIASLQRQLEFERYFCVSPGAAKRAPKAPKNWLPPTNPPQSPPSSLPPGHTIRTMPPTAQYPNGYWRQYDSGGNPVNPATGRQPGSVTKAEAAAQTHIPLPGR
jgi:RHS repeat-associated protein